MNRRQFLGLRRGEGMNRREFLARTAALPSVTAIQVVSEAEPVKIHRPKTICLQVAFLDAAGRLLLDHGYKIGTIPFFALSPNLRTNRERFACTLTAGASAPCGIGVWDLAGDPVCATGVSWPLTQRPTERETEIFMGYSTLYIPFPLAIPPALDDGEPS